MHPIDNDPIIGNATDQNKKSPDFTKSQLLKRPRECTSLQITQFFSTLLHMLHRYNTKYSKQHLEPTKGHTHAKNQNNQAILMDDILRIALHCIICRERDIPFSKQFQLLIQNYCSTPFVFQLPRRGPENVQNTKTETPSSLPLLANTKML